MFLQLDDEKRIVGMSKKKDFLFNIEVDDDLIEGVEDHDNYIYENGKLVRKERDIYISFRKQNESFEQREEMLNELPDNLSDIQDGLIEVAEMTAENEVSMADVQDALVELADMISSLLED